MYVWGIQTDTEIPKTGKIRYIYHSELGRREQQSGSQREKVQFTGRSKSKCIINVCWTFQKQGDKKKKKKKTKGT